MDLLDLDRRLHDLSGESGGPSFGLPFSSIFFSVSTPTTISPDVTVYAVGAVGGEIV